MGESICNPLPMFFLSKEGLNEIYDGVVNKLYEKVAVDPASAFGDYGCATVYKLNDADDLELIRVEYLEPRK